MIQVKANRTNRDPNYRIGLTNEQLLNIVAQKFSRMPRKWKVVKAYEIKPGLCLHYRKCEDGLTRVSFEEEHYGVANADCWYTEEEIIDMIDV